MNECEHLTIALGASTLHLGRPIYAYRAMKMWRRSWLSREVLLFACFSGIAGIYSILLWYKPAMMADLHLPLKPRSDIALINGMIHLLIEHDLVDREYIASHTTGFDALELSVRKYTPEYVARITGLDPEAILKAEMTYGNARAPFIGWTMGVNHSTQGTETVNAINNLALITGNVGKPGASPFSITGQCNAMGTREAGFTSSLPGYRKFESAQDREQLAVLWNVSAERIPTSRGLAYPDIIEAVLANKIRALWVIAINPIVSYPNLDVLTQSLENLEFFVVQDGFHPTPTSELANLVLPAAIWGKKEGTYTNSERPVSKVNRAVEPPGEARPDFDIFLSCSTPAAPSSTGIRERKPDKCRSSSNCRRTRGWK